jgi:hypothetical protein
MNARDVLGHDDGVVDDEARRDGERHQRQVVEAVARQEHEAESADERQRHGDARDRRRRDRAKKTKTTTTTRNTLRTSECSTSVTDARIDCVRSLATSTLIAGIDFRARARRP